MLSDKTSITIHPPQGGFFLPMLTTNGEYRHPAMFPEYKLNGGYGLHQLESVAALYDIPLQVSIEEEMAGIDKLHKDIYKQGALPRSVKDDPTLRPAGAFFSRFINPWMAKGRDAYKPSEQEVLDFCGQLASGADTKIVLYYALSKTRSPIRTGSPDVLIDLAELEMLRYHARMVRTAQELGFNFRTVLVDETTAIPSDSIMGFSEEQKQKNVQIAHDYINKNRAGGLVNVRSLIDSVREPLGRQFDSLYYERLEKNSQEVSTQVTNGEVNQETKRALILVECMPDEGLAELGLSNEDITSVRNISHGVGNLTDLPQPVLQYVVGMTAHIRAVMDLREPAGEIVRAQGLEDEYPEYDSSRLYGGVTRSSKRWSFLPVPHRYKGTTRNPMHGLAIYNNGDRGRNFEGYVQYTEAQQLVKENTHEIAYIANKPIGVVSL